MRILLTVFFSFLASLSFACECSEHNRSFKEIVERTDYIAHVKIKDVVPVQVDSPRYSGEKYYYKIIIEEIKHFIGKHEKEIIVAGGHPVNKVWTSCDLGIMKNTEWIIFAEYFKGKTFTYPCTETTFYKHKEKAKDFISKQGAQKLSLLNQAFQML